MPRSKSSSQENGYEGHDGSGIQRDDGHQQLETKLLLLAELPPLSTLKEASDPTTVTTSGSGSSREPSIEHQPSNIPRRCSSRISDPDMTPFSQQPNSQQTFSSVVDPPGMAANARKVFENQSISCLKPKASAAVPTKPEAAPPLTFPIEKLLQVVRTVMEAPTAARIDLSKLPKDPQRFINEVSTSNNLIFNAINSKFDRIVKLLQPVHSSDWKSSRHPIAEQHPVALLDSIVDAVGLILATFGIWCLHSDQPSVLISQMDTIAVSVSELQRKLITQMNKAKASQPRNSPPDSPTTAKAQITELFGLSCPHRQELIDALGPLTSCLSTVLQSNLKVASSLLSDAGATDPLIVSLTKGAGGESNLGSPKSLNKASKQPSRLRRTVGDQPSRLSSHWKDHVSSFVKTVHTLISADLCCRLFEAPELRTSLKCLQSIRSGLEELAQQRAFEYASSSTQELLPHRFVEMPNENLIPCVKGTFESTKRIDDYYGYRNSNKTGGSVSSIGSREVQLLLGVQLEELATAFRALYRFVGSILGGSYEDPAIVSELTDASVLSSYVTMVGFLFHQDLMDLAQWMLPMMSQVRKKIKQQTAVTNAINACTTPRTVTSTSEDNHFGAEPQPQGMPKPTPGSAASLLSLLEKPDDICLTRLLESETLLSFFLPYLRKSSSRHEAATQIGAPADRVNRVLVWLAWEGGLTTVYEAAQKEYPISPSDNAKPTLTTMTATLKKPRTPTTSTNPMPSIPVTNTGNEQIEDAIVNAVIHGCRIVKGKLTHALQLFNQPTEWSGRGEDILDFCQRVTESITLRYMGELDLRQGRDIHSPAVLQQPKWSSCLLLSHARSRVPNKTTQMTNRVVEALPKLFGEYCHQSLFYSCPLHQAGLSSMTLSNDTVSSATTSRLDGVTRDLDLRITNTQSLAEAGVLNSHSNFKSIGEVSKSLAELTDKFEAQSKGVIDRHKNTIKGHTDRLEQQGTDINKIQQQIKSHQARLESHAGDMKKFSESIDEYKTEIQRAAKAESDSMACTVASLKGEVDSAIRGLDEASLVPHIQAIDALKVTATQLQQDIKRQEQQSVELLGSLTRVSDRLTQFEVRLSQSGERLKLDIEQTLQVHETQIQEQVERLQKSDEATRLSLVAERENTERLMKELADSILVKSKGELSAYLTEKLSCCVRNYVVFHYEHLEQEKKNSSSRKRLAAWAAQALNKTPRSQSLNPLDEKDAASMMQSVYSDTRRSLADATSDDLTSLAGASFVMDESCATPLGNSNSFADYKMLDLPDPSVGNKKF